MRGHSKFAVVYFIAILALCFLGSARGAPGQAPANTAADAPPAYPDASEYKVPEAADAEKQAASLAQDLKPRLQRYARNKNESDAKWIRYDFDRLYLLGAAGIGPLAEAASNQIWSAEATVHLSAMFSGTRLDHIPMLTPRPVVLSEISASTMTSLTRITGNLKTQALGKDEAASANAVIVLIGISPKVPAAATTVVDLAIAGRIAPAQQQSAAAALMNNTAARNRIAATAARPNPSDSLRAINDALQLLGGSPAQLAKYLATATEEQRSIVMKMIPENDARWDAIHTEMMAIPEAEQSTVKLSAAGVQKALQSSNALVRARAAMLLPPEQRGTTIAALAGGLGLLPPINSPFGLELRRIGPAAIEPVMQRLKDSAPAVRAEAVLTLEAFLRADQELPAIQDSDKVHIAKALVPMLSDSDRTTRYMVLRALQRGGPAVQPVLIEAVRANPDAMHHTLSAILADPAGPPFRTDIDRIDMNFVGFLTSNADPALLQCGKDIESDIIAVDAKLDVPVAPSTQPVDPNITTAITTARATSDPRPRAQALGGILDISDNAIPALSPLLLDPDPAIRSGAAQALMHWPKLYRAPDLLLAIVKIGQSDPYYPTRFQVSWHIRDATDSREMYVRIRRFIASTDQPTRLAGLWILRRRSLDTNHNSIDEPSLNYLLGLLRSLLNDPSPQIRVAAAQVVTDWKEEEDRVKPFRLEVLANPNADVRAIAMDVLPKLDADTVKKIAETTKDPDLRIAARLMDAQHSSPLTGNYGEHHAPFDVAAAALASPSRVIRFNAARDLVWDDPADPTRKKRGTKLLTDAINGTNDDMAISALSAAVPAYCGEVIEDAMGRAVRQNAPRVSRAAVSVFDQATEYTMKTMEGSTAERIKAIRAIGNDDKHGLSNRYDLYSALYEDPDPSIRAEAIAAARKVVLKAIAEP